MNSKTINIKGQLLSLDEPQVMGILNVTPDSFYAGSRKQTEAAIIDRIETILREGSCFLMCQAIACIKCVLPSPTPE